MVNETLFRVPESIRMNRINFLGCIKLPIDSAMTERMISDTMHLIDSHCHLLDSQKNGTLDSLLTRAEIAGVQRMISVGTSENDWVPYRELHARKPARIEYTVGLHPSYVDKNWELQVNQISNFFIPPYMPVAFGEIGLDYFHLPKDPVLAGEQILLQEAAFQQQLMLAADLSCPIIIHSREALDASICIIDDSGIDWQRIVFHCFTYDAAAIKRIRERGGRASFTGIVTYKSAHSVREALIAQGIETLMLETDCPYLSPEPKRGQTNEPAYLQHIAAFCAELLQIPYAHFCEQIKRNTEQFYGLHGCSEVTD